MEQQILDLETQLATAGANRASGQAQIIVCLDEQCQLLANLPEFVVKDMSSWFYTVAVYNGYNPVRGSVFDNLIIKVLEML